MTVAVGDIYQCQFECRRDVESASIIRHFVCTDVTDTDEDTVGEALVSELTTQFATAYLPLMGPNANLICTTARRLPPAEPTRTYVNFTGGVGSGTLASRGAQQALLISLYPESGAQVKQGRNYMPFISADNATEGQVLASVIAAIEAAMISLFATKYILDSIAEFDPAIARKVITTWIADAIQSLVVRPVLATQRRRVVHHQTTFT